MTSTHQPRHRLSMVYAWLLMVFLVLFPKGGFKIGDLPLTWGYLILGATMLPLIGVRLLAFSLRIDRQVFRALLMLLPMQVMVLYAYLAHGIVEPSYAVSTIVNLFVLPPLFLLVYPSFLGFIDGRKLSSYLRNCILLAALWGIGLFIEHPITGHYLEIPYLTVNAQDYGLLESTKHIVRGPFLKLISTYNNGNLYGTATLILLPIYTYLEPSRWRRAVVKIALLLTLSRTIWLGLIFNEMVPLLSHLAYQLPSFPIVRFTGVGRRMLTIGLIVGLVLAALIFVPNRGAVEFLLDPTAGGRTGAISSGPLTLLPSTGLRSFQEIFYLSAVQDLGIAGLFSAVLLLASPLLLLLRDRRALGSPMRRAALRGLVVYSVVSASDCGFNYIPVMAFYWFVYMIYLFDWPAFSAIRAHTNAIQRPRFTPSAALPSSHAGVQLLHDRVTP